VRSDGTLLCLSYVPEHDVWGWSRHVTREGTDFYQSAAVIPESGVDILYTLCKRSINGSTVYMIETMPERTVGRAGTDDRQTMYFVDSGLTYDGTNTTAITLTLTGGTTWETGEAGLTLTASEALFPGDTSNVGNGYRLVGADGSEVEVEVTTDGSTTVQTVTLLTDAPASTQATATSSWVTMVDDLSGLDHLEGESVAILADGVDLGTDTVSSGAISTLSRPYGVIHVGLPIVSSFTTVDIDEGGDSGLLAAQKRVPRVTAFLNSTRGASFGAEGGTSYGMPVEHGDTATGLITGKRRMSLDSAYNREGRVVVTQSAPLPCGVGALVIEYEGEDI
jgi:hypothetical protein